MSTVAGSWAAAETFAGEIRVLAFMDGGRRLAVVSCDAGAVRTIRAWDVASVAGGASPG